MKEECLDPDDIPDDVAERSTKGFASFECRVAACPKKWKSAHASCKIHLKEFRISKRYTQDCKKGDQPAKPKYSRKTVQFMAGNAVKQCLKKMGRMKPDEESTNDDPVTPSRGPHDKKRCEKCRELGRSCWKKRS